VSTGLDTFPKLLAHNAERHPDEIALREKDFGIWQAITWRQYQDWVEKRALALHHLGVRRGDVVGLIGDNRPSWVVGEIAAHALGALSLGLYRDALEDEVAYLIEHAAIKVVFAEDEEQIDKLLGL
jgi:long-chain acyl-CoA synthetase